MRRSKTSGRLLRSGIRKKKKKKLPGVLSSDWLGSETQEMFFMHSFGGGHGGVGRGGLTARETALVQRSVQSLFAKKQKEKKRKDKK